MSFMSFNTMAILDFSPERESFAKLASKYFSKEKREKITEIAKYGHIYEPSDIRNMQNAFNENHCRKATAEHLFIFSMYFHLGAEEARTIFHMCEDLDGHELTSFSYAGGALYYFLQSKNYDYDEFMKTLCEELVKYDEPLVKVFSNNKSWQKCYAAALANKDS